MTKGRLPVLNELYTNLKKERQLYNFFFIVLLIVGIGACIFLIRQFSNLAIMVTSSGQKSSDPSIVANLIAMQANTLTIVAITVSIASIVLTVLGFLQWKQTDFLKQQYKVMQKQLKNTYSLALIQSMSSQEFYVQVDMITANDLQNSLTINDDNSITYFFYCIQSLVALEREMHILNAQKDATDEELINGWKNVVSLCQEILKLPDVFDSIKYIVKVKFISANYQLCRCTRPISRLDSLIYIKEAKKMLQRLNAKERDPYGHIENLQGLVQLWETKCNQDQGIESIKYDEQYAKIGDLFASAIKSAKRMNRNADISTLLNHLAVAKMNQAGCLEAKDTERALTLLGEADKILDYLLSLSPNYSKAYLNKAHIKLIAFSLSHDCFWSSIDLSTIKRFGDCDEKVLDEAILLLEQSLKHGETLKDVYYRQFEVLVWKIIMRYSINNKISKDLEYSLQKLLINNGFYKSKNVNVLFSVPLADEKCITGFLIPWRNYTFWRSRIEPLDSEKTRWKEVSIALNLKIMQERPSKGIEWAKLI